MNKTFTQFLTVCFFALGAMFNTVQAQSTPFITRWDLSKTVAGANTTLSFGVETSGTVNYTWQEVSPGTASGSGTFTGTTATITGLPADAVIDLSIEPANFQRFNMMSGTHKSRLMQIKQWGSVAWTSMRTAFQGCNNMTLTATDVPNLASVADMHAMFSNCSSFKQALPEGFNTASVTDMGIMFSSCTAYNQALPSSFNTEKVTQMVGMFSGCIAYNKELPSSFNTEKVTNMSYMFNDCIAYNQVLPASFSTVAVTNMGYMFSGCKAYNKELPSSFNTAAVTDMSYMFNGCSVYNQALPSSFNTEKVTNMSNMFNGCKAYNQALPSNFNTAAVTNMSKMFINCRAYNQALPSSFTTAAVTDMSEMFWNCPAFNQSLAAWGNQLNANVNLNNFLDYSGMSVANYDATLTAFAAGSVTGRSMGATGLKYCTAEAARTTLTNSIANSGKGWTITGDAKLCPTPTITTSGTLTPFTTCAGTASTRQSFTVSGSNLTEAITITALTGFEVGRFNGEGIEFGTTVSIAPSSGTVASTTIYVRMAANATGSPSGNISCASTGATTKNVAASGTVNTLPSITLGSISSVNTTATSFSIPYTATTGSPDQYSLVAGTPTAMPSFTAVSNTSLPASPMSVTIPASAAGTYNFNLTVRNSTTGCVSAAVPVALEVTAGPPPTPFITRWDLSKTGGANTTLGFDGEFSGPVSYSWQEVSPGTASGSGTIPTGGGYSISGLPANAIIDLIIEPANFRRFNMNFGTNRSRLMEIKQWGSVAWTNMQNAFLGCNNMTLTATDVPNLAGVTNMESMFRSCSSFNQALPEGFNTETVTNMISMFEECTTYNQALPSSFNTAAVTSMRYMFAYCNDYNQTLPIGFNTENVTDMYNMFRDCQSFNKALPSTFNTEKVTDMSAMFLFCKAYNQALPESFNIAAVTDMNSMFSGCTVFNQSLASWGNQLNANVDLSFFLNNSGMSVANYDATLTAFAAGSVTGRTMMLH